MPHDSVPKSYSFAAPKPLVRKLRIPGFPVPNQMILERVGQQTRTRTRKSRDGKCSEGSRLHRPPLMRLSEMIFERSTRILLWIAAAMDSRSSVAIASSSSKLEIPASLLLDYAEAVFIGIKCFGTPNIYPKLTQSALDKDSERLV
jgi:hypothetical protein